MSNQILSRPGALPTWPTGVPLSPDGLITYSHPNATGYTPYSMPVSAILGSKVGVPTATGVAQVAGITLATAAATAGTWLVTLKSPFFPAPVVVTVAVANGASATTQATNTAAALNAAISLVPRALATVAVSSSAGLLTATQKQAAANDSAFALTMVATGITGTTQATTGTTAGVLGTPVDYLGQHSIGGTTVYVATSALLNTWTPVN